jgi:flagellar basal-body rod protein FlgB
VRIFDATLSTLERSLDVRLARQAVLAGNVANADTPGYSARELDFDAAMAATAGGLVPAPSLAAESRPGDMPVLAGRSSPTDPEAFVFTDPAPAPGLDGNAVDLDRTLGAVAENAIQYGAAAKAAAKKLAILRYVASDGQA